MATFTQLTVRISKRLLDPSNTAVAVSDVQLAINDSISEWKKKRFWFNTKTASVNLVAGSVVLTPPADFLIELPKNGFTINYGNTRWPLEKITPSHYDDINNEGQGMPRVYTWAAGQYQVYYKPDQAYQVDCRYLKEYADLVDDSDENDFTTEAQDLIMYDALSKLHGELRQDEKMETYYAARTTNEYNTLRNFTSKYTASGKLEVNSIL